jgi:hypothetical protein
VGEFQVATDGGIWVAAGAFLWLFPATLASKLLRGGMESVSAGSVSFHEWRDLCFVSVGTFVLARAVPTAIYWIIVAVGSRPEMESFTFEQKASVLVASLEVTIGLGLVLGGLSEILCSRHIMTYRSRYAEKEQEHSV